MNYANYANYVNCVYYVNSKERRLHHKYHAIFVQRSGSNPARPVFDWSIDVAIDEAVQWVSWGGGPASGPCFMAAWSVHPYSASNCWNYTRRYLGRLVPKLSSGLTSSSSVRSLVFLSACILSEIVLMHIFAYSGFRHRLQSSAICESRSLTSTINCDL